MTTDQALLDRLCTLHNIALEYTDIWGQRHVTSAQTKRALLAAMGVNVDSASALEQALEACELAPWQQILAPVLVIWQSEEKPGIAITTDQAAGEFDWTLVMETGEHHGGRLRLQDLETLATHPSGNWVRRQFPLPLRPPMGYHRFELSQDGRPIAKLALIVAPDRCYHPAVLAKNGRVWGPALQLYALRSQRNWGIGDLVDLRVVLELAADLGAAIVGVNPLNALFSHNPNHASPYSPSSRLHLNILYLDIESIPEFSECQVAQEAVNNPQFQARLRALRASELVDYAAVAEVKFTILELLYRYFRTHHLASNRPRGRSFRDFQSNEGEMLRRYALFEALQEHFQSEHPDIWGWPVWPASYRNLYSEEVAAFSRAHEERIEFYEYLQWRLLYQLEIIGNRSLELGLSIGLYQDLAVGVDRGGAEVWANPHLYAVDASTGAPPDAFNLNGQDWGLPPFNPKRLIEVAYQPFIATLRRNMRFAGALRIDHVMGLMRLFWVPADTTPKEGTYVGYPFRDLLGILALESHRNQCLVIGEDLGTVPEAVREAMASLGIFSYRLFYFEKEANGDFKPPTDYPNEALVAVSTHDLPTLNGYWQGIDLDLRDALSLYPSQEVRNDQIIERAQDRARLRVALERQNLLPPDINVHSISVSEMTPELSRAVHLYLARSPAQVMMVQMEDVFAQTNQVNMPGSTTSQYPNWRYKLVLNLEDWSSDPRFQALTETLRQERGVPERAVLTPAPKPVSVSTQIPDATYRLQFHSGFTFTQATAIVPYLNSLGISHCYASPYLRARPGSTHGYDIIDHNALNPEIGSREEFERFNDALKHQGMGQILDIVPNHMGVMGSDNTWWLDVLENGPAAVHAPFFDIDWQPFKEEVRGKVLLPVLGDHYGAVLENGQLQLCFDAEQGSFHVQYYEHKFPVDPHEYRHILGDRIDQLEARLGADEPHFLEYQSLVTAFSHLPERRENTPERVAERARDKEIHKRHLAGLCQRSPDIAWFVEENLRLLNGTPGEPQSFDMLHNLLEAQAYRLSYWRVASDDINYRRFFDINDLAGLRMENKTVFEETHRLVMELLAEGKLDGLRIDHPDGLYNPKQYFQQLQRCSVTTIAGAETTAEVDEKPLYVVVEKILESYERLPEDWPVYGTTGYDFTNLVNGLLVDSEAEATLDQTYQEFIEHEFDFEELLYQCKKFIMEVSLDSELNVLANQLSRIAQADRHTRDFTLNGLRSSLEEVVACFPVYRTYITSERVSEDDKRFINWAVSVAKKRSQWADVSVFDFVRDALLLTVAEGKPAAFRDQVLAFAMKFQQYTGPLMAKGLEDTSFYRYNRLMSLNEVGGDPRRFGVSVSGFHLATQERVSQWPHAMLSTSTHDSKRSEDVRARITVLSELAEEWDKYLKRWVRLNKNKKRLVDDELAPSRNDEYLLYQTLLGAWPLEQQSAFADDSLRERIENYMLKAVKEAKVHSSWTNANAEYEEAVKCFVAALLDPDKNRFLEDFLPLQQRIAHFGLFNSLSQTLLKLTLPGVPDIYQGTELWDFSLVDPDNRRPVDYDQRLGLLQDLHGMVEASGDNLASAVHSLVTNLKDGRVKLYTIWKTLALRREQAVLFRDGEYIALSVAGDKADHICAFARRYENQQVLIVVPRLTAKLMQGNTERLPLGATAWSDTYIVLPENGPKARQYVNVFTQEQCSPQETAEALTLPLAHVLENFPLALLLSQG